MGVACVIEFLQANAWFTLPFFLAGFLSFITYVIPILVQVLYCDKRPVNLKTKYGASWALVTGASSGEHLTSPLDLALILDSMNGVLIDVMGAPVGCRDWTRDRREAMHTGHERRSRRPRGQAAG